MESTPKPTAFKLPEERELLVEGKVQDEPLFVGITAIHACVWTLLVACALYFSSHSSFEIFIESPPPPPPPPVHWFYRVLHMEK